MGHHLPPSRWEFCHLFLLENCGGAALALQDLSDFHRCLQTKLYSRQGIKCYIVQTDGLFFHAAQRSKCSFNKQPFKSNTFKYLWGRINKQPGKTIRFCTCLGKAFKGSPIYKQIQTRLVPRGQTLQESIINLVPSKEVKALWLAWHLAFWEYSRYPHPSPTHYKWVWLFQDNATPSTIPHLTFSSLISFLFIVSLLMLLSIPIFFLPAASWTCAFPLPLSAVTYWSIRYSLCSSQGFLPSSTFKGFSRCSIRALNKIRMHSYLFTTFLCD